MAIRDLILRNGFAHRFNKDGTADSICLFCYARVASLTNESELGAAEANHNCWRANDRAWNEATQRTDAIGFLLILGICALPLASRDAGSAMRFVGAHGTHIGG